MNENNIFISYARADSAFVLKLAEDLEKAGIDIWLDQKKIAAGKKWDREIDIALKSSGILILVISPKSAISDNVANEVLFAINKRKTVIPVIIEQTEDIPFNWERFQRIDLTKDYEQGLNYLVRSLRHEQALIQNGEKEIQRRRKKAGAKQKAEKIRKKEKFEKDSFQRSKTSFAGKLLKKTLLIFLIIIVMLIIVKWINKNYNQKYPGYTGQSSGIQNNNLQIFEVQIGNQVWMAKNLDVSRYRNGDPIPEVQDPNAWNNLTMGAWCYYNNDPEAGAVFGKLYNWYAVNDPRGLAPEGWHVPNYAEWTTLTTILGGPAVAGGNMKAVSGSWIAPNTNATNSSGFSGLPGGGRFNGGFFNVGTNAIWWSSTASTGYSAWGLFLFNGNGELNAQEYGNNFGFSVRCVRN